MLAVARALVPDNKLLLIESKRRSCAYSDPAMMEAIRVLSETTTILLVEQNFIMASQLAERYTIIDDGKSVRSGGMQELVNDTELIHHYWVPVLKPETNWRHSMNPKVKKLLITVVIILVTLGVIALLYISAGKETFIRTALSGLTLDPFSFWLQVA